MSGRATLDVMCANKLLNACNYNVVVSSCIIYKINIYN